MDSLVEWPMDLGLRVELMNCADSPLVARFLSMSSRRGGTRDTVYSIWRTRLSYLVELTILRFTSLVTRHTRVEMITRYMKIQEQLGTQS